MKLGIETETTMPVFRSPERVRKSATESRNGGGGRLDEIQTTSRNRWGEDAENRDG